MNYLTHPFAGASFKNLRQGTEQDFYDIIYSFLELIAPFRAAS